MIKSDVANECKWINKYVCTCIGEKNCFTSRRWSCEEIKRLILFAHVPRIRKNSVSPIWQSIAGQIANYEKWNYRSWNFGTRSSARFHSFWQPFDWSIMPPCYVSQGWIDKRINVRTDVAVAALFSTLKIDRTREREREREKMEFSCLQIERNFNRFPTSWSFHSAKEKNWLTFEMYFVILARCFFRFFFFSMLFISLFRSI